MTKHNFLSLFLATVFATNILVIGSLRAPCAAAEISHKPRIALVLGGGGVRGAAHVGVLKVLEAEGIKPDMVIASSTGAMVGGLYSAGVPTERIEKLVLDGSIRRAFFPIPIPLRAVLKAFDGSLLRRNSYPGLYSGKSVSRLVNKVVPPECRNLESMPVKFSVVATNLINGQPEQISTGDLGKAIQASAAWSPLYKPVIYGDHVYVDGGLSENLPVERARNAGADVIIIVNLDEDLRDIDPRTLKSMTGLASRMSTIVVTRMDNYQYLPKEGNVMIKPDITGIPLLAKDDENIRRALKAGEQAAIDSLPEIRKQLSTKLAEHSQSRL